MVVKVKEYFDETRHIKNNDKSKKFFLRGQKIQDLMKKYYQLKRNLIFLSIFSKNIKKHRAEIFSVNITFKGLSNDVSHFVLAQSFIISTCLSYVDIFDFCHFSRRLY